MTASSSLPKKSLSDLATSEGFHLACFLVPLTLILVLSTVLLVVAAFFVGSFRLQLLAMASDNFVITPVLMIISSFFSIAVAICGFTALHKKQFNLYVLLACLSLLVFLILLLAVVFSFLLLSTVASQINKVNVEAELRKAAEDMSAMETWDTLQTRYKCCGGRGNKGYIEWEQHLNGTYPDSCCTVRYPGCGRQAIRTAESVYERIHVRGCITTIKQVVEEYVIPLLLAWGVIGLVVMLAELVVMVLCLLFAWEQRSRSQGRALALQKTNSTGQWEEMPLRYTSTVNVHLVTKAKH